MFRRNSMEDVIETMEFTPEEKLTHYLLLNAALMSDMGILNGRMKAVIHFLELSRAEHISFYEDFAIELLDEILDSVNDDFPVCFGHGVCGIGWGVEYILRKRFLTVDEDVCAPYDRLVARYVNREHYDGIGVYGGLTGVLLYYLARIENPCFTLGDSVLEENKRHVAGIIMRISRMMTDELVLQLMQEKENPDFVMSGIYIYSKWEYPVILHTLGLVYRYGIEPKVVQSLLECLVRPLKNAENVSLESEVNKELLRKTLIYVYRSVPAFRWIPQKMKFI